MTLFKRFGAYIENWYLAVEANAYVLALFRILYAIVSLIIAIQITQYMQIHFAGATAEKLPVYALFYTLWIASLILILLGYGGRVAAVVNLILTPLLLDETVDKDMLMIGAMLLVFIEPTKIFTLQMHDRRSTFLLHDPRGKSKVPGWPLVLAGLAVGALFLFAGISKTNDPLWRSGWGLYYSFLQPWIKWPAISFLANSREIMLALNMVALVSELAVLPLFVVRKTRDLAILLTFSIFGFFTFILRIDPIGPAGLLISLALFSISSFANGRMGKVAQTKRVSKFSLSKPEARLALLFLILLMINIGFSFFEDKGKLAYPVVIYPFTNKACDYARYLSESTEPQNTTVVPQTSPAVESFLDFAKRSFRFARYLYAKYKPVSWYSPFNLQHIFGRYEYRIQFVTDEGEVIEPIEIFYPDLTNGPRSAGILRPRILQNRMWAIGIMANRLALYEGYSPNEGEQAMIKALINFSANSVSEDERDHLKEAVILVAPIVLPNEFSGNVALWGSDNWFPLVKYDWKNQALLEINVPPAQDLGVPSLQSAAITLCP
jgi:hypothetical protein